MQDKKAGSHAKACDQAGSQAKCRQACKGEQAKASRRPKQVGSLRQAGGQAKTGRTKQTG
jgi:hypothetical protein